MAEGTPLILLDRGHGGDDPGAVSGGLREVDLATVLTKALEALLNRDPRFSTALTCPYQYRGLFLAGRRARAAGALGGSLLLSQHFNAGGGTGFEAYAQVAVPEGHPRRPLHEASTRLARLLGEEMAGFVPLRGEKGLRYRWYGAGDYYALLRQTSLPAVLVENGFVDSPGDMERYARPGAMEEAARRQYRAVCRFFGWEPRC